MSNLPVPKQNDVYYWETKIYDKPDSTLVSVGMATKPYPLFRLPGFHKSSVAYLSNGTRRYNQPFNATPYGPHIVQGDVIGVGYRPRTGTIFFTRNGKKLEDVVHGVKSQNFFPSIGANGPCIVHVNFGQAGFVFIEANVKKWGLAPMTGSLAPPPPYGVEADTVLLATGTKDGFSNSPAHSHQYSHSAQLYRQGPNTSDPGHTRSRSGNFRMLSPTSPGPLRSPTDISLAHLVPTDDGGEPSSSATALVQAPQGHDHQPTIAGLGLHPDHDNRPPPEYTSPEHSDAEEEETDTSRRNSSDSENAPLIRLTRSRGASLATSSSTARGSNSSNNRPTTAPPPPAQGRGPPSPPIPTYQDAIRQGAGRDRSDSARSARSTRGSR
jgi:hypothetical protein